MSDQDILPNDRYASMTATGGESSLPGDFPLYDQDEVTVRRTRAGVQTTLTIATHYTVNGVGGADFDIALVSPALAGDFYELIGATVIERSGAYSQNTFKAGAVNRELDRMNMIQQELRRDADAARALLLEKTGMLHGDGPPDDALGADGELYLDETGLVLYGPKVNGAWPAGVSLGGPAGWTPILAAVTDSVNLDGNGDARVVWQIADWIGGEGSEPATGGYIGASGQVVAIADAVNVRGSKGAAGLGSGDVVGPASATDGYLAGFDGATGKLIKVLGAITAAGLDMAAAASAAAQRTLLGLGALALKATVDTSDITNSAVTYGKMQNVTGTDRVLGRSSSGAGVVEEIPMTAAGRALAAGADAAAQRATLGLGALATVSIIITSLIDNAQVTLAKLANIANNRILGNVSGGAAAPAELTGAQVTAVLDVFVASGASHAKGLVPSPGSSAGTTRFLREDASWQTPAGGGAASPYGVCNFRLSLASGVPVMTSDQLAKTVVYVVSIGGKHIGLYDGAATWDIVAAAEHSIKLIDTQTCDLSTASNQIVVPDASQLVPGFKVSGTGIPANTTISTLDDATHVTLNNTPTITGSSSLTFTAPAGTVYDLFDYSNAGTAKAELCAWTNPTTRATALTTQDGVLVKTGATTRRYLGSFATTATDGQTEYSFGGAASGGTAANLLVYNYYNRTDVEALVQDSASTWSYTTATLRSANNSTGNRINFVVGVSEDRVAANYHCVAQSSNADVGIGVGLDSTSAATGIKATQAQLNGTGSTSTHNHDAQVNTQPALSVTTVAAGRSSLQAAYVGFPGAGLRYLQALEIGGAGGVFSGSGNASQGGLVGHFRM